SHAERAAQGLDLRLALAGEDGEARVGEAHGLQLPEGAGRRRQAVLADLGLRLDDALLLRDEPGIDLAGLVDLLGVDAEAQGLGNVQEALGRRRAEGRLDRVLVVAL